MTWLAPSPVWNTITDFIAILFAGLWCIILAWCSFHIYTMLTQIPTSDKKCNWSVLLRVRSFTKEPWPWMTTLVNSDRVDDVAIRRAQSHFLSAWIQQTEARGWLPLVKGTLDESGLIFTDQQRQVHFLAIHSQTGHRGWVCTHTYTHLHSSEDTHMSSHYRCIDEAII